MNRRVLPPVDFVSRATMVSPSTSSTTTPTEFTPGSKRTPFPKSDIRVNLADHYTSKAYTSGSPVTGDVTITTKRDVRFDQIQIVLLGHTKTIFEGMSVPQEVTHTFLKMLMPVPESTYPVPRVLENGQTYTVPFNFVIPHQLTINACNHARLSDQLQDHHTLLPPSIGGWERDDMAPKMAQVEYTIKARVLREDVVGGRKTRIMEAVQNIQVLPASAEEPPLNVTANDNLYRMSKSKTIRKNILSAKLGRLTAEAAQPGAAVISADGRRVMSHPMARVKLTFTPESGSSAAIPPAVTAVSAKITAHTYFSSNTISSFPNLGVWNEPYIIDRRGQFSTSTSLPTVSIAEQPAWTPAGGSPNTTITRRDSGYCSTDTEQQFSSQRRKKSTSSSSSRTSKSHHPLTTTLTIPLSLPTSKKIFLPTFHSCLASRVYTVHLTLSLAGSSSSTLSLTVPLQVAVEGASFPNPYQYDGAAIVVQPPAFGALPTFEEAAADEHLRPRVLRMLPNEGVFDRAWMMNQQGQMPVQQQEDMVPWQVAPWQVQEAPMVTAGDVLPGYGEYR